MFNFDLYTFISSLCSDTYTRICRLAGKPTLLEIAYRAAKVITEQYEHEADVSQSSLRPRKPKFLIKIEKFLDDVAANNEIKPPKEHPLHEIFMKCRPGQQRRLCVHIATDMLLRTHLGSKGYGEAGENECRVCDSKSPETLMHILYSHVDDDRIETLPKTVKRKMFASAREELRQLATPPQTYQTGPRPTHCQIFSREFENFW